MMDLNGHEAGNGGYSQGKSTVHRVSSTRRSAVVVRSLYKYVCGAKYLMKNKGNVRLFSDFRDYGFKALYESAELDAASWATPKLKAEYQRVKAKFSKGVTWHRRKVRIRLGLARSMTPSTD
jgi:hypothetical protein